MKTLTNNDLIQAAADLRCEVAAIRAVDEVESNGMGFYSGGLFKGNIVLRFESAKFRDYTGFEVNGSDPMAYSRAVRFDARHAMLSTSWGRYQIMGFNYEVCGYQSVEAFVAALKTGEAAQLQAFVKFVIGNHIDDELRTHNWAGFAYRYNGAGYRTNRYDEKLASAYAKYSRQPTPANDDPALVKKK